ncbi:speriolin-like protein [Gadus macrocephalus]|uniref:speriolin-like protein n=1 Tax=Gadus macrocephalus TaxID=80720 RepID=UPI0028CB5B50|nr:speriolin-like protein [Gadus macrocephalus]
MVLNLVKESLELTTKNNVSSWGVLMDPEGSKPTTHIQDTLGKSQFRRNLHQRGLKPTSSFNSDPERLIGEIAFQLDRRILSHVFQSQARLYGFTVLNIPEKIIQVSSHPLIGRVDEGYGLHVSQRYTDLMGRLAQLGYNLTLHPPFTEFIVNTYGILKQRPDSYTAQKMDYNNVYVMREVIFSTAPGKLVPDLLLLLSCLSDMARTDRKPLLLW